MLRKKLIKAVKAAETGMLSTFVGGILCMACTSGLSRTIEGGVKDILAKEAGFFRLIFVALITTDILLMVAHNQKTDEDASELLQAAVFGVVVTAIFCALVAARCW